MLLLEINCDVLYFQLREISNALKEHLLIPLKLRVIFCSKLSFSWNGCFGSGWCLKIVSQHSSMASFYIKLVQHVLGLVHVLVLAHTLVLVHVLSLRRCTKTST